MPQLQISINSNFCQDQTFDLEQLLKATKMFSDNFLQTAFNKFMTDIQNIILLKYLVNKWTGSFMPEVPDWSCPHCQQNIYGFKRRGKRKRIIKSSFGKLHYSFLQVTCRKCNKTFSPFPKLL